MARTPSNLKKLELIAKDEWAKTPVETCEKLSSLLILWRDLERGAGVVKTRQCFVLVEPAVICNIAISGTP
ncbi:hypothetical protein QQF64_019609 [Cirrhinus molitorella]|uniref:Uncharacterized protein n=1 Tax=Cirrhinus molitorella TaxID=172907 RepID=A0ABR3LG45_9TELE